MLQGTSKETQDLELKENSPLKRSQCHQRRHWFQCSVQWKHALFFKPQSQSTQKRAMGAQEQPLGNPNAQI